ncbi:hypothetical protein [Rhizobium sp. RU20A]|uniref:hypothetical protein n=1 Tax=Rhizobium sp. RU20A TaxID=1907412 RepID=UPI001FCE6192|nr:hypothetical protein [Rhizobium sp. RU20A]
MAKTALADPDLIKRKGEFSATIVASTPDAPKTHVSDDIARWGPIVKDANIRLD